MCLPGIHQRFSGIANGEIDRYRVNTLPPKAKSNKDPEGRSDDNLSSLEGIRLLLNVEGWYQALVA